MKGDAPDESEMSAEQLCITRCVAEVDSSIICGASKEGETGNSVCQKCASDCVHLYEGPCLDDAKLKSKQKECETCEHCYGEPVTGPSGEGWDCIVDVKCNDASSQFGDNPGTGAGVPREQSNNLATMNQESKVQPESEGIASVVSNSIGNVVEAISKFFSGLFGG